jgi:hypothetical protein
MNFLRTANQEKMLYETNASYKIFDDLKFRKDVIE